MQISAYGARVVTPIGILTSHGLKNSLALVQVFPPQTHIEGTWEALRLSLRPTRTRPRDHAAFVRRKPG
ncbi:MAG: hypothetical protein M3Z08_24065 [Chloroflexota bacterium]|nr:hypothetical protein [Chloroflexota bacterium]